MLEFMMVMWNLSRSTRTSICLAAGIETTDKREQCIALANALFLDVPYAVKGDFLSRTAEKETE